MKKVIAIGIVLLLAISIFFIFFNQNKTSYNLTEKYGITGDVVDYGVYEESGSYGKFISSIYEVYLKEKEKGKKVYFVFGDEKGVNVVNYEDLIYGKIKIISGKVTSNLDVSEEKYISQSIIPKNNEVNVIIEGEEYKFQLKPGEDIYFIISENE